MRVRREEIAASYRRELGDLEEIDLPSDSPDRIHSWHLFPIRLRLDAISVDRDEFIEALKREKIGCSVHWRPLHLHPYYQETFGWSPSDLPVATAEWVRLVSLPLFPAMTEEEIGSVVGAVRRLCARFSTRSAVGRGRGGADISTVPAAAAAGETA